MGDKDVAIKGGFWTGVSTGVAMLTALARVMVLTRFLTKSDFGIVSITNMVIALCATFTDLGFASVIMYKQQFTDKEFSSLYWMQLIVFVLIYGIIILLTPFVANFYEEPTLTTILPIAALTVLFQAIGQIYESVLQKQYRFKLLAFRNIVSNFVSLVLAVILAWKGFGVYSLVYSTLSQMIIINIWNFITGVKIQRPRFIFDIKGTLPLVKIGIYQTGTRILDFFSNKFDVMIIGKLLGTDALGVYDLAKELVYRLINFVRSVVSKVAMPILANNNNDDNAVRARYLQITKTVAYICVPICISTALFSHDAVRIIYGEKFLEAVPLVTLFALAAIPGCVTSFFDMLGVAKGRTDLNFKNTIFRIIVTTPIIAVTSLISIKAVAWGGLIVSFIMPIIFWYVVVQKTYPMPFKVYLAQFSRMLVVVGAVAIVVAVLMYGFNIFKPVVDNWIVRFVLYASLYVLLLVIGSITFLREDMLFYVGMFKNLRK